MRKNHNKQGFTLVELVIVIAILGILATIAVPLVSGLITKANISADETKAQTYTLAVQEAIQQHSLKVDDRLPAYKKIDPNPPATAITLDLSAILTAAGIKLDAKTYATQQKNYVFTYDPATHTISAVGKTDSTAGISNTTPIAISGVATAS